MFMTQPKIFISSTIKDMPNERKAAFDAVTNVGAFPIMSEFTIEAQNADSLTVCLDKVKESDIYVLILGGCYGWQPNKKESITELEFQTAKRNNIPLLVFNTTYYQKDKLQQEFEMKAGNCRFYKIVNDAFELKTEIEKALQEEISKKQNEYFNRKELVYSNLVKIKFPQDLFMAKLNFDKKEVKRYIRTQNRYKSKLSLHDYVVAAIHMNSISFPRDWVLHEDYLMTFHDLRDSFCPLSKIIDIGTAERFSCEEIYNISQDSMSTFKYLLKRCLETKLHKKNIKWIKEEGLFAFIPIQKDDNSQWQSRKIQWQKTNKNATRTVVDIKRDFKDKSKVFNLKCLAFRTKFEYLDKVWYVSIKPDWIFLWSDLTVCHSAFENIQWLKKTEKNAHVFNHFNFILKHLQSKKDTVIFSEYEDYRYLSMEQIEKFDFAPIVPDDVWINLESPEMLKKLKDKENIGLFGE